VTARTSNTECQVTRIPFLPPEKSDWMKLFPGDRAVISHVYRKGIATGADRKGPSVGIGWHRLEIPA